MSIQYCHIFTHPYGHKLIILHSCISSYAKNIDALVNLFTARVMSRLTRLETSSDALLAAEEEKQDNKKMAEELLTLGPLGELKEDKIIIKYLEDINIGRSSSIYVEDKAKYITSNDTISDFLRLQIQNIKKNAQQFRQESVRNLRQSCSKFFALTTLIIDMIFSSLDNYFHHLQDQNFENNRTN